MTSDFKKLFTGPGKNYILPVTVVFVLGETLEMTLGMQMRISR